MNCLSRFIKDLSYVLEQVGLYEPVIDVQEAKERLYAESVIWEKFQSDRDALWKDFQANNQITGQLHPLAQKGITHLSDIRQGIAVDLGCGINSVSFNLLEKGWKVYAVDSSNSVIQVLREKGHRWIASGQLILVNQTIEEFKFPEKVHLVTAIDSLPYCNPEKINTIFLEVKNNLLPKGVFVGTLFPFYDNPMASNLMRAMFGGWMTTKNVVDALLRSADFASWTLTEEKAGEGKKFHLLAQG